MFDGVVDLLTPVLRADPHLVAAAKAGNTDSVLLKEAQGVAHVAAQGVIRNRLKTQIHRQMRDTVEHDRGLPERPTLLARWVRITEPPAFEHVVHVEEGEFVASRPAVQLPEPALTSLTNVLHELHRAEAGEESGAWLVARVRYDGYRITLERAFDSLPHWYDGPGPTLRALTWEMQQRSRRWRPAWALLLPD
jgi:hypothetical protein